MATIRTAIQIQDGMSPAFRSMNNALNIVLDSFEALQNVSGNAVNTSRISEARTELSRAETAINQVEQGIRESTQQQEHFNNTVRSGGSAIDGIAGRVRSLVGAYVGIRTLQAGMEATDTYISNGARLDLINDGLQTQAELQDKIYQAAQRSRGEYNAMVNTVAKLGLLAGDAFSGNDELIAFTELMNKSFKISGASTQESTNAMYQLTQAMASGRLQGDEYRSIIENAPMLANAIADYCGVSRGELKQLASDGAISADVIKAAVFSTADDIEDKFAKMPMTFSDAWTMIKNTGIQQFSGLMQKVNGFLNSNTGKNMVNGISSAIGTMAMVLGGVFDMVMGVSTFFSDNWSTIEPIIWGIVGAFVVYNGVLAIYNTCKSLAAGLEAYHAAKATWAAGATLAQAAATTTATGAQVGLNMALLACPITWIIAAIILVIVCIYAVIGAINNVTGTTYSATGFICGLILEMLALIWNVVIGTINAIIQAMWTMFVEPFISIIEWVLNVANGGFNSFGDAVANLIGQIISWFLSLGTVVTKIIDAIFGSNWTAGLNSLKDDVLKWGKNENAITLERRAPEIDARIDYGDAFGVGYDFGVGIDNKMGEMFNPPNMNDLNSNIPDYASMGQNLDNIAGDTGKMSDSLDTSEEDLKYLRDIAEQEAINRFTTAEIKVDMTNHNNINKETDFDGVMTYFESALYEKMVAVAEGVHD